MPCGASATCCASRAVFPSIRAQLTAWLALLVTLCLAAFALYLYVAVAQILTADLDQTLRGQAHQVANLLLLAWIIHEHQNVGKLVGDRMWRTGRYP